MVVLAEWALKSSLLDQRDYSFHVLTVHTGLFSVAIRLILESKNATRRTATAVRRSCTIFVVQCVAFLLEGENDALDLCRLRGWHERCISS